MNLLSGTCLLFLAGLQGLVADHDQGGSVSSSANDQASTSHASSRFRRDIDAVGEQKNSFRSRQSNFACSCMEVVHWLNHRSTPATVRQDRGGRAAAMSGPWNRAPTPSALLSCDEMEGDSTAQVLALLQSQAV